jgi:lysyl-tRNA synthetase class 2
MPSSVIRNYRYRPHEQALDIIFVSGRAYRYLHVPPKVYEDMLASFSKGEFFNQRIRDHFAFERTDT